ncbi:MAG: creatininase family protein [Candidatus Bathyarchaeota archaeon]|nr:creatininase family protein [Candidatus Bathyarchaeota archaeon]
MTKPKKPQLVWLDELSTKEAAQAAKNGTVIIFPLGSVEEHGDHLPLGTDSIQPEYIAVEVAKKTGCLVAPPFRYGICNATRNFPGTLTIQFDTLYRVAHDILSELIRNGFYRIIVLSGHAGNSHMVALRLAAQDVMDKNEKSCSGQVRIMVLSDFDFAEDLASEVAAPDDGHAGTIETSRVLAIKPELVKGKGKAEKWQLPRFEVLVHPERCFPGGVNGDPTSATVEKGEKINEYVIGQVEKLVRQLQTG